MAGDVAFQAAHDLCSVEALGSTPGHITTGVGIGAHAGEDDAVEGSVGLTVTAPVESIPVGHFG